MTLCEFEKRWLDVFAEGISKKQLEKYVTARGNHIWHLFSWELLPKESYLTGNDARQVYNNLSHYERETALFIEPFEKRHPESFSMTWQESSARQLDQHIEIFVVAEDFSWTYIKTHEGDCCGPYFYRKKKVILPKMKQ